MSFNTVKSSQISCCPGGDGSQLHQGLDDAMKLHGELLHGGWLRGGRWEAWAATWPRGVWDSLREEPLCHQLRKHEGLYGVRGQFEQSLRQCVSTCKQHAAPRTLCTRNIFSYGSKPFCTAYPV